MLQQITLTNPIPKGHFKCFHCRTITPNKSGDWVDWDGMQVHLCKPCDKKTAQKAERQLG